jgi:hypothetical protein
VNNVCDAPGKALRDDARTDGDISRTRASVTRAAKRAWTPAPMPA